MPSSSTEELMQTFYRLIEQYRINLIINPTDYGRIESPVALDVEHDENGGLVGIGIYDGKNAYYWTDTNIGPWITDITILAHNGVSDFDCLRMWGIPVKDEQLFWDTRLIGHIIDSSLKTYGLKDMAKRELGIEYPSYDDIVGKRTAKQSKERVTLDKQPMKLVAMYNAMDTYSTYKLSERQKECLY